MISGTFEAKDMQSANWVHLRPRRAYLITGVLLLLLFLWAIWYSFFVSAKADDWGGWIMLGVLAYFVLSFGVWMPLRSNRSFRQRKDLQRPVSFELTDAGLSVSTPDGHGVKPWSDYHRWKEGRHVFLLYLSDNMYQVFPKRFFTSIDEIDQFRNLVRQKVSGGEA